MFHVRFYRVQNEKQVIRIHVGSRSYVLSGFFNEPGLRAAVRPRRVEDAQSPRGIPARPGDARDGLAAHVHDTFFSHHDSGDGRGSGRGTRGLQRKLDLTPS